MITGIGHETDFTIADFVADLRAPTPSAAAELVGPDILALQGELGYPSALSAKTFVYCSEGSPENFTPSLNTTGTSLDAARPVLAGDQPRPARINTAPERRDEAEPGDDDASQHVGS